MGNRWRYLYIPCICTLCRYNEGSDNKIQLHERTSTETPEAVVTTFRVKCNVSSSSWIQFNIFKLANWVSWRLSIFIWFSSEYLKEKDSKFFRFLKFPSNFLMLKSYSMYRFKVFIIWDYLVISCEGVFLLSLIQWSLCFNVAIVECNHCRSKMWRSWITIQLLSNSWNIWRLRIG